ncbi:MAG TPA: M24 family metallopeptidase [Pyrinomonadaceae bacterium]|jgi:antitoxin VapB|nr:M24 family metallopeptidase [Pyrinomonadaceae bacterium]
MNEELEEKTGRLVELLERENIGAVLLNSQHNFAWLTGGGSNGIDASRENGAASLLVRRDGRRFVVANNIEMPRMILEEASAEILGAFFEPVEYSWQDEKTNGSFVIEKAKQLLETGAVIATDIPIDPAAPVIENKIAACRYRLTSHEIDRYRLLGRDAGTAVRRVIGKLDQGETELEIAEKMRHELALGGMASVVTLVAADERISRFRHPLPTANRWKKTLLLVTCAKRGGLIVSLSRMVRAGSVPDELKIKTEAAAYINACLLDATKPGTTGAELYAVAAKAYSDKGFADEINRHHQGGAAGYKTREWVAHPRSAEVVQPGQAFAWNPTITGTKIEETYITAVDGAEGADGVEVITASPDFPQIASTVQGREYFSPGILSL